MAKSVIPAKLKRRGTTGALAPGGFLAGLVGVLGEFVVNNGQDAGNEHWLAALGIAALSHVLQAGMFWVEKRADVDLERTRAATAKALSDGTFDRDDAALIGGALASDLYGTVDQAIGQHGLEKVVVAVQDRIAEGGVDAGGGPAPEDDEA